jgi:hypothetical protein
MQLKVFIALVFAIVAAVVTVEVIARPHNTNNLNEDIQYSEPFHPQADIAEMNQGVALAEGGRAQAVGGL